MSDCSADPEGRTLVQSILDRKAANQQTYLASPDHSFDDILMLHRMGYAVPGDGDHIARWRNNHA